MLIIKKYSNRRLYHTKESRYITLDELAETIREGTDVRVQDAKSGTDLTQATLAQIIFDSRGAAKLLPAELLTQMIRMGDEALAEFLGKYVTWALEMYNAARRGAKAVSPYFPLANVPFNMTNAMARMLTGGTPWAQSPPQQGPPMPGPPMPEPMAVDDRDDRQDDEIAALRRELEALKDAMTKDEPA